MRQGDGVAPDEGNGKETPAAGAVKRATRAYNNQLVPRDHSRIDLDNAAEVAYWCANFRCTGSALRAAVEAVGPSTRAVMQHLQALGGLAGRIAMGDR